MAEIVEMLTPLPSEERQRVIQAALTMLGETPVIAAGASTKNANYSVADETNLPGKAKLWLDQNSLTLEMLQQAFHINAGVAEVIAEPPGSNKKEKTLSAYILTGIANYISTGEAAFTDDSARTLCVRSGCYDKSHHAEILKERGNEFTGSKSVGWLLTAPGLKRGATFVRALSNRSS